MAPKNTGLVGNTHTAPLIRTPTPVYRIETLWCGQCDREIDYSEPSAQVNVVSGPQDISGPFHYPKCATAVRNALNESAAKGNTNA